MQPDLLRLNTIPTGGILTDILLLFLSFHIHLIIAFILSADVPEYRPTRAPRPLPAIQRLSEILGEAGMARLERELSAGSGHFETLRRQFSTMEYASGSSDQGA